MAPNDPKDVAELRRSERHVALVPLRAYLGTAEVVIQDLSEGGFQIEHADPIKLSASTMITFDNPKTYESIEFRVRVVWSRLSSTPNARGKLLYRSGLRIEQADEVNRNALRRLIASATRPDTEALDRKRKKASDLAKERSSRPVVKVIRQSSTLPQEHTQMILQARKHLRSNPVEALRWHNRARFSLTDDQIKALGSMNIHYRDDVLAVWEYLDRRYPIALIAKAFEDSGA
jgi:hypothetical protein